jgi:hypothetical protein
MILNHASAEMVNGYEEQQLQLCRCWLALVILVLPDRFDRRHSQGSAALQLIGLSNRFDRRKVPAYLVAA